MNDQKGKKPRVTTERVSLPRSTESDTHKTSNRGGRNNNIEKSRSGHLGQSTHQRVGHKKVAICGFCSKTGHAGGRNTCPVFRDAKRNASAKSYVSLTGLRRMEQKGFAAAGVLVWRKRISPITLLPVVEILMAKEVRRREGETTSRLNFVGGKRDFMGETAEVTARRELDEETGGKLSDRARHVLQQPRAFSHALWSASSKYALFVHQLATSEDIDLVDKINAMEGPVCDTPTLQEIVWVDKAELMTPPFAESKLHSFARTILKELKTLPRNSPGVVLEELGVDATPSQGLKELETLPWNSSGVLLEERGVDAMPLEPEGKGLQGLAAYVPSRRDLLLLSAGVIVGMFLARRP